MGCLRTQDNRPKRIVAIVTRPPDVNPAGVKGSTRGVSSARFHNDALAARADTRAAPFPAVVGCYHA